MKHIVPAFLVSAVIAATLAGCYGGKLVKMPINAEMSSVRADSLWARQKRMLDMLTRLEKQVAEEREARVRYQAQSNLSIQELEETVRILTNKLEEASQFQNMRSTRRPVEKPPVDLSQRADTSGAAGDTTSTIPSLSAADQAEDVFRGSYLDLTRGNYDLAVQGFKNYLVRFPAGQHLPEVHYYLGECYYARDRHLEAVSEFQYVVREFPDSRLAPAAYLKSALCYESLGEKQLAEKTYRELLDRHPHSEEAQQARDALENTQG